MMNTTTDTTSDVQQDTSEAPILKLAGTAAAAAALLAGCGGGSTDASDPGSASGRAQAQALIGSATPSTVDAWRFLNQATMGPTREEVAWVSKNGFNAWLSKQFSYAQPTKSYATIYNSHAVVTPDSPPPEWLRFITFAWWNQALGSADQLRQRVVQSLSEILVISLRDDTIGFVPYLAAGYLDMLSTKAFGNFRQIIEGVAKSPAMAHYLSHIRNMPPVPNRRIPDQNFARELIQLFTLGLSKLNMDGTYQLDASGQVISTTNKTDIALLSNVFTGWGLDNNPPVGPMVGTETDNVAGFFNSPQTRRSPRYLKSMIGYPAYHSTQAQATEQLYPGNANPPPLTFLETPFSFGTTPDESLGKALDIIFAHQNLAPFIAKQMIQRMVTSNPSPGYVYRVATAFKNANWDMQALIRGILLDDEARNTSKANSNVTYGKLREPLLRITHLMRAFGVTICYPSETDNVSSSDTINLNQSPLLAPSVFNYFSPTYQFSRGSMASLGKVIPEMQIATEATVAAYINAVYAIVQNGIVRIDGSVVVYTGQLTLTEEIAAAGSPAAVVALINAKLFGGSMSAGLQTHLVTAATPVSGSTATPTDRVRAALFLAAVSPEYLVQK